MKRERYIVLIKGRGYYFREKRDALAKMEELKLDSPPYLSLYTYEIPSWVEDDDYTPYMVVL